MEREKAVKHVAPEIRRMNHLMGRNIEAHVRAMGMDEITLMHGWIIRYLHENKEKDIFHKDIEKKFCVGRSSVTNILQLMEKKEYLRREAVKQDARLKKLVLTEKGESLHMMLIDLIDQLNEETMRGITEEEFVVFFRVMKKIEENIGQQSIRLHGKENEYASDNSERSKRI